VVFPIIGNDPPSVYQKEKEQKGKTMVAITKPGLYSEYIYVQNYEKIQSWGLEKFKIPILRKRIKTIFGYFSG
jgi:hypothetical protein